MSQICNSQDDQIKGSALFGNEVEAHIAKGSAFFCGASSEMFRFMGAGELNQAESSAKYLDTAVAYLEASMSEYDKAIRKAGQGAAPSERVAAITQLDYTELYKQNVQNMHIPDAPDAWNELASVARSGNPDQLLQVFRGELVSCLDGVNAIRAALLGNSTPEIQLVWNLGSRLAHALTVGQSVATIYQATLDIE